MRWVPGSFTGAQPARRPSACQANTAPRKGFRALTAGGAATTVQPPPCTRKRAHRRRARTIAGCPPVPCPPSSRWSMNLLVRLHDAVDDETVLNRLLPVLAHGGRRVAYATYDQGAGVLSHRWATPAEGDGLEEAKLELEPERLHTLLGDDAGGDRPLRPVDSAAAWVLR